MISRCRIWLWLACLVLGARAGWTQFEVTLTLDSNAYLRFEPIIAHVRIENFTGHTIGLFDHDGKPWLSFHISRPGGEVVEKMDYELDTRQTQVAGGESITYDVNLTPLYNIRAPGWYRVMAVVHSASYNRQFKSNVCHFDLVTGRVLWQENVALPSERRPAVTETTPEAPPPAAAEQVRTYALVAARLGREEWLYVRVENERENLVYGTLKLGKLVSPARPAARVDRKSHLHVLHQTGARSFAYVEISPDVRPVNRKVYSNLRSQPVLRSDESGHVWVEGGEQAYPSRPPLGSPLQEDIRTDTPTAPPSRAQEGTPGAPE